MELRSSRDDFSPLSWQYLDFKHFLDVEMSLEHDQSNKFKDQTIQKVQLIEKSMNAYHIEYRV